MVCPNCGRPVGAGEKFCGSCGYLVSQGNLAGDGAEAEKAKRKKEKRVVLIVLVVLLALAVLITVGVWLARRSGTEEPAVPATAPAVETTAAGQTTLPAGEENREGVVFDIFTYYNPYTQNGLTQDEVIALHGEPQSVVQDPEGYTGAVEWQYADRVLRFWDGEVYYLQMRNTSWAYESTDDFREMFHLLETEHFWENAQPFYRAMDCGAYQVCIGYDAAALQATYLSVIYEIPEPWSVWLFGGEQIKDPPLTFNLSELYNAETGYAASPEDIIALYGEPASITEDETDFQADKYLHYDYMRFGFIADRLCMIAVYDIAWSYTSIENILTIFGLQASEQTQAEIHDVFYEVRNCGIRWFHTMIEEEKGFLFSPDFRIE